MEQRSNQWHELRKSKIGASDVPIVCGVSPYKTPYTLWLEKSGRKEPDEMNIAMQKGIVLEDVLRNNFQVEVDEIFMPKVNIHPEVEFLMASLDGINIDNDWILEIKTCGKLVMENVKKGEIPLHHKYQAQCQLMCTPTAKKVTFNYYNDATHETHNLDVFADEEIQRDILFKCTEFYEHMIYDTPPPLDESDFLLIEGDNYFKEKVERLRIAEVAYQKAKKEKELARKELLDATDDASVMGYGVKVRKYYENRFDYKKACEDNELELTEYKSTSIKWRISWDEKPVCSDDSVRED